MSRIDKSMETEVERWLPGVSGRRQLGMTANGYRLSSRGSDGGDGCAALPVLELLSCTPLECAFYGVRVMSQ